MTQLRIKSVAPSFRRAGIQFSRSTVTTVNVDSITEDQYKQLNDELASGRNLVIAPNNPADEAVGQAGGSQDSSGAATGKAHKPAKKTAAKGRAK